MKKIDEIKEEYAKEQYYDDFESLLSKQERIENIKWHYDNLCKRYAIEACKEALKNASENARMKLHDGHHKTDTKISYMQMGANNIQIDKQSILSETNIPKEVRE